MDDADRWMSCSACRAPIRFGARHWVCSVSTCNRPRTRLVFCSVACWDTHVVVLRHRDAGAVEAVAPSLAAWQAERAAEAEAASPVSGPPPASGSASSGLNAATTRRIVRPVPEDGDILIVVSKMKKYIRDRSGMNCSDSVAEALSHHVRALCDAAVRTAGADGRKTVLDRDVPPLRG